jgi:hypothetical protein
MRPSFLHTLICLVLSTNYFAFQVELFEEEYERNHPDRTEGCSVTAPRLTWESFDKENASQAFVFDAGLRIEFLFTVATTPSRETQPVRQPGPVRDKSPPPDGCASAYVPFFPSR